MNRGRNYDSSLITVVSLFFLLFAPTVCLALDPNRAITQYVHNIWKTEQGLTQRRVNDIIQTKDGFLWLTSHEALVRFDGVKFTVFENRNIPQLMSRNLPLMAEDHEGNLWIATEGAGIARYKNGVFQSYTAAQGLSDNSVLSLAVDRDGSLWVGTQFGGLNHLQNGKVTVYNAKHGTPGNRINVLYIDEDGTLWIGGEGLAKFKNGIFTTYTTADGLSHRIVSSIVSDRKGGIWLGTWGGGVNLLRDGKFQSFTTNDGLSHNEIRDIHYDRQGNLWVGTRDGGLCRFLNGKWETFSVAQGLSDKGVRALYEDREGSLWIGTYNGGLNRLKDGNFISYSSQEGLINDEVWSIYGDRHGDFWMGTTKGVVQFSNGKFISFGEESGLSATNVVSVHGDSRDRIWVGTRGGGLFSLKNGQFIQHPLLKGSSYLFINCLYVDRSDNVWVGTADGLIRVRNGDIKHYSTLNGLGHNSISSILEDRSGKLLVGTRGGLSILTNNRFQSYPTKTGIISLYEDHEGILWIGLLGGGLCRFQSGQFRVYSTRDGLYDDIPAAIEEDNAGNLWISGSKGIFRISKNEIANHDLGRVRRISSVVYGVSDGMKDAECNSGDPCVWKGRDGRLWFPTPKGITVVDPAHIENKALPPKVRIEGFYADQQYYDPMQATLKIPPGRKRLDFHFAGLSLLAPEKVRFEYRLDGYDKSWTDPDRQRFVSYTNIPPGRYTFRVKARNDDSAWNEPGTAMTFFVEPRFYQTKWFYLLTSGVLILMIVIAHRLRVRRVTAEFKAVLEERTRIAREIHDSLAQALAGVVMHLETAKLQPSQDQSDHHVNRALNLARMSVGETRYMVGELRRPDSGSQDLFSELKEIATRQTSDVNLELKFDLQGTSKPLPETKRLNLLRICQEAIQNVVKHARAKSILITLIFGEHDLSLRIIDNGCGFDVSRRRDGHYGLTGIHERVKAIGGTIKIQSAPGEGTEIQVTVPFKS